MAIQAGFRGFDAFGPRRMAHAAGHGLEFSVIVRVVTVRACERIAFGCRMHLMIKKDFAGIGLIHQPERFLGWLNRKGGITNDGYEEKLQCHAVYDHSVLLGSHLHKSLTS